MMELMGSCTAVMNVADVHLDTLTTGSLPFEYLAFFLVGTVPRAWRYGSYARPARKGKPGTRPQDFLQLN